jgi:L-ascorbate metabolism protein UlaG (beta-lactamase superfamily)
MLEITWLGHGTFELRLESGEVFILDPWIENNPAFPKGHAIDRVDAILITHGHYDHIEDAVALARKFSPKVVAIFETCLWLGSKGVENLSGMNKGGTQQVAGVSVTMTNAVHSCGINDGGKVIYGGEACGYVLRLPDARSLYFAGDTAAFSDMLLIRELYKPELAFLPIGDLFTMGPREAALACRLLQSKKVIPTHFGTYPPLVGRPEQLAELVKDQVECEVWPLEPGKTVKW